jgi:hypothetical protein
MSNTNSADLAKTSQAVAAVVKTIVAPADLLDSAATGTPQIDGLSNLQQRALDLLATGTPVIEATRRLGIPRSTFYHWLKRDPLFQAAYNRWHEVMEESCRAKLATLMDKATAAVERALDAGNAKYGMQLLTSLGMAKPRKKKITDPETLKRKSAVRQKHRERKLIDHEEYLGLRQRSRALPA